MTAQSVSRLRKQLRSLLWNKGRTNPKFLGRWFHVLHVVRARHFVLMMVFVLNQSLHNRSNFKNTRWILTSATLICSHFVVCFWDDERFSYEIVPSCVGNCTEYGKRFMTVYSCSHGTLTRIYNRVIRSRTGGVLEVCDVRPTFDWLIKETKGFKSLHPTRLASLPGNYEKRNRCHLL